MEERATKSEPPFLLQRHPFQLDSAEGTTGQAQRVLGGRTCPGCLADDGFSGDSNMQPRSRPLP